MPDFQRALDELLNMESEPLPASELEAFAREHAQVMASLNKKQTDMSLQVEEIYEIISENHQSAQELAREEKRRAGLLAALIGVCDIVEDFCAYAAQSGDGELSRQASMMWGNAGALLGEGGVKRLGERGQPLDPKTHAVQAAAVSDVPREHVADVLRSGYGYMDAVLRKAAVIISTGADGGNRV